MGTYNLYWTPCAAHCLDLMFEDIGKKRSVDDVVKAARQTTKFIYNHGSVLSKMREANPGEIVRPGATRFATNYLALRSLRAKRAPLRNLFTSQWWEDLRLSSSRDGKWVADNVLQPRFWQGVDEVCNIFEPMYSCLRLVDSEVHPTMGLLYYVFREMRKRIQSLHGRGWVVDIINHRWNTQLCQELHEAGTILF